MSNFSFSKKIALRYLWARRGEAFITIITFISVIGVAIGVMVLTMVMGVMTGFESELKEKILGANSHVLVRRAGGPIAKWQDVQKKIEKVDGVDSVSPYTYHQGLVRTQTTSSGLLIRGIAPGTAAAKQLGEYLRDKEILNDLFNFQSAGKDGEDGANIPGIIVGKELARALGLAAGMPVSIFSPQVGSSPFGLIPKFRRFKVLGVYNSGLVEYEGGIAYAALADAQAFFHMEGTISGFEVRVKDIDHGSVVAKSILAALGGVESGFTVQDWTETNKPLWDALRLEKRVYFIVLLLIIVMASFSIVTSLIMIVLEKRKDIAILKTMGAKTGDIAAIFRIQGGVIGLIGTVSGLALGYAGSLALRYYGFPIDERIFQMSTVPVKIEPINFALVGVAAFVICLVATVYPSRRASGLQPIDVLRYE